MSADSRDLNAATGWLARFSHSYAALFVAIFLLTTLAGEEWLSIGRLSMTFDEGAHLYAGYQHWTARDFGVNPEHPPLVKLVAAAPLLGLPLHQPDPPRFLFLAEENIGGGQLLSANNGDLLLTRARRAASLFTFALAVLLCAAGWEMFGPPVGLLALALFTFEPTMLAHGALVTTDMGVACFVFASMYAFYRYLKHPSILRLALCGLAVGLALASKVSGVVALPILAFMAVADCAITPFAENTPHARVKSAGSLLGALLIISVTGYVVLWIFYTFRYAARPGSLAINPTLAQMAQATHRPWLTALLLRLAAWHVLPEAYLYGWAKLYSNATQLPGFLFGRLYPNGTWLYFPAAFLIKSSLPLLVLLAAAPFVSFFVLRRYGRETLFLWIGLVTVMLACMPSHLNIGIRHALAVYPFALLLAATSAWAIAKTSRLGMGLVAALLLLQCVSALRAYPDYLPYSNEAFGGSSKTYRVLSDSNVDWAQQLKEVNSWLAAHPTEECWFAYSLPGAVAETGKKPCKPLPTGFALLVGSPAPIVPAHIHGTVLISAMDSSGVLWGSGDANPYRQFADGQPAEMIGNSILVYHGDFDVALVSAQTHASQVRMLMRMHQPDAALREAQTAVELAPQSAALKAELGGTYLMLGKAAEAQQAFALARKQAREHQPNDQSVEVAEQIDGFMRGPR